MSGLCTIDRLVLGFYHCLTLVASFVPATGTVWGPDYVDEIVCRFDESGAASFYLQDANYNVTAVLEESTGGGGGGSSFLNQYVFEPYGVPALSDSGVSPHAPNRIGWQGLFFDRLDGHIAHDPLSLAQTYGDPPSGPFTGTPTGLYLVRNRVYNPRLGRFLQRDPNAISLPVITALSAETLVHVESLASPHVQNHYRDGLSLYGFSHANPIARQDPLGLFGIVELGGVASFTTDQHMQTVDTGMSLMGAIRGFVGIMNTRSGMLTALTGVEHSGPDTTAMDRMLGAWEVYQGAQSAMLAGGVISAGSTFATKGLLPFLTRGPKLQKHHGIHMFLGGWNAQELYRVPERLHKRFHSQLNEALKAAGLPDMRAGEGLFRTIFGRDPGKQQQAFGILMDVAQSFDRRHRTDFLPAFQVNYLLNNFDAIGW